MNETVAPPGQAAFDPVALARQAQGRAIDPTVSAWVSASAGSGKTTVLTNRVLALMLAGVAPERILCLTFTKAAAAEMANRISGRLGAWVTDADDAVLADIAPLLGRDPDPDDLRRARRLFARVLDAPGGLRIETIHAFCQSLLRRFPIEAGVSPQFDLMDERSAAEALAEARDHVIASSADAELAAALAFITARVHETRFPELVAEITRQRTRLERLFDTHGGLDAAGLDGAVAALRRALGLTDTDTAEGVRAAACGDDVLDVPGLKRAAAALAAGSAADQERGAGLSAWLNLAPSARAAAFDGYTALFLTKEGEPRKTLATKAAAARDAAAPEALQREAARLAAVRERLARLATADASAALLTLAAAILRDYRAYKRARSLLDYDDLIETARRLLQTPGAAAWVLYKLDGGLDHVLIDEAQDTNPGQWEIVAALTEEFFAGLGRFEARGEEGARPGRTVFAVGDRKQSIYSFQGADPEGFNRWRAAFAAKIAAVGKPFCDVGLNVSFRSTEAVLKTVDLVFRQPSARGGVAMADETIAHLAARIGAAGRVELWPPVKPAPADDPPPWKPPVERVRGDSPQNRLALLIARRIARMIRSGERLPARDRPIRAGDVMVLVRRRTGFVDELVRQLKALEIPVAGVDRMVLPQQLAVMDLMALGRFLLLPGDDLTLATVLKSPLIGLSEDDLFDLAWPRGEASLWEALSRHAGGDSVFGRAHKLLEDLLARVDYLTPYELFAHVCVAADGRRKTLGRLGLDADDPIDEFLSLALAYERNRPPSLQAFLHWVEQGGIEIKRDLEQDNADAVRIMTVHGAKGLQAPIVFLPDTLQVPTLRDALVWTADAAPVPVWTAGAADRVAEAARQAAKERQMDEYRRLLYVALTRAEDRLYVCGWENSRAASAGNWYELIERALSDLAAPSEDAFLAAEGVAATAMVRVLESAQTAALRPRAAAAPAPAPVPLPAWTATPAPPERDPPQPLAPSRATRAEPAALSPLAEDTAHRYRRGLIVHRLLQTLPELPPERRRAAAEAYVARPAWRLPAEQRRALVAETLGVLETPAFAPLFAAGALAEVPVVGLVGRHAVSGQVDRLAVTAHEVWIVDYKTNRPAPRAAADVDPGYVTQMAVYREVLRRIYPHHAVRCVLLWTDGPRAMELPTDMLDAALAQAAGAAA